MLPTASVRMSKNFWSFLILILAVGSVCGICAPGFAQHTLASKFPAGQSSTDWSSLPPDAQRAILDALESDASGWMQQGELTASDGATNDTFGQSVAISGSTLVVGAPLHTVGSNGWQGAAYVFVESDGTWSQKAELIASDGSANDKFGWSLAISGNTIVVGAFQHTVASNTFQGAAYVYAESGGTWSQQAELTASDGGSYQDFGYSVAVSGTTVVVGAYNHPVGSNTSEGAAYVFVRSGTKWSQQAELTSSDGGFADAFGQSVALSGSTALVGAPDHQVGSNYDQGAAYVFVRSGTKWSQQAELTSSDGATDGVFGSSVAISGATGVVGVGPAGAARAYVFAQNGQTWIKRAELTVPNGFCDVAVDGGIIVVGACVYLQTAYVFAENGGTWSQQAELTASDGGGQDLFGSSVAISGSTVVIGAPNHKVVSNPGQGAAYVLLPSSTTVMFSPTSLSFGNQAINTTSAAKTVVLKNTGAATLYKSGITITAGNSFFAISRNTCGTTLAAGKTCEVSVTFTPTQLAAESRTLAFTDSASRSPQTVSLTGTGVAQATLTPATLGFGNIKVGTTSAPRNVTLMNNLSSILSGISYTTTGPFVVSTATCGTTLITKKGCTISVTFSPKATGNETGSLTVKDSANNSPQKTILSGTGD